MMSSFFITGISTEVGKTIVSAIFAQALKADYWKPIQSGDLVHSDSHKIKNLVDFSVKTHPNSYALKTSVSPHQSAKIDKITIDLEKIITPKTENHLVIEGAGGILVPLNDTQTIIDIVQPSYKIILVSRHYLGSINHTLMTIDVLKSRNIQVAGIVFSGNENIATESIISKMSGVPIIGRIDETPHFNTEVILYYANVFKPQIASL